MKSLRARVGASIGMRGVTGITMLMSSALGQATPDTPLPEPSILPLLGAGVIALVVLRRLKK
jgi:hypothetical protein